jgi:hypothetical protein
MYLKNQLWLFTYMDWRYIYKWFDNKWRQYVIFMVPERFRCCHWLGTYMLEREVRPVKMVAGSIVILLSDTSLQYASSHFSTCSLVHAYEVVTMRTKLRSIFLFCIYYIGIIITHIFLKAGRPLNRLAGSNVIWFWARFLGKIHQVG